MTTWPEPLLRSVSPEGAALGPSETEGNIGALLVRRAKCAVPPCFYREILYAP